MAVGGWDYYQGRCVLASNFDDTLFLRFINEVNAVVTSMPNWSVKAGPTKYCTNGWHTVFANSVTNAELCFAMLRDSWSGNAVEASNNVYGGTYPASGQEYTHWVAYCPPGATFAATNPATSGFVPSNGFQFVKMKEASGEWNNPGYHWLHCLVRDDDDLILLWEYDGDEDPGIERTILAGGCITPAHASDTGSMKNEGLIVNPSGNNLSGSNMWAQYFASDSATRLVQSQGVKAVGYQAVAGTDMYHQAYPWPFIEAVVAGTGPVVTGNGVKGRINHEWYRMMQGNGPANPKQQFDSGNFIFIRDWGMIGWDPSNGDMR